MAQELRGWKDIGAHFGTSDRTAQRWEREHGMPVHRTGRTRGASVFALPEELDRWRLSPEGLRARSDNSNTSGHSAVAAAVLESARPARGRLWFLPGRKTALALAVVVVVGVGVGTWFGNARWWSRAMRGSRSPTEAYTVPNSSTVFVLKVTIADRPPFLFHVLDGGMATLAARGGIKLGFVPARGKETVKLAAVELRPSSPNGAESLFDLKHFLLAVHSPIHFDHAGMAVTIEWVETVKSSDLPTPPADSERKCCVVCENVTACAAQVSAQCGSCCGFGGCAGTK